MMGSRGSGLLFAAVGMGSTVGIAFPKSFDPYESRYEAISLMPCDDKKTNIRTEEISK